MKKKKASVPKNVILEKVKSVDDKSLPTDLFLDVVPKPDEGNKKKSWADIYEEKFQNYEENDLTKKLLNLRNGLKHFRQLMADPHTKSFATIPCPTDGQIKYIDTLFTEEIVYLEMCIDRQPQQREHTSDYEKTGWFKVSLKFATGEMQKLLRRHNNNCHAVAREMGNEKGYRPFISQSIIGATEKIKGTDNGGAKNIFNNESHIKIVVNHCKKNNIIMCDDFIKHLPQE